MQRQVCAEPEGPCVWSPVNKVGTGKRGAKVRPGDSGSHWCFQDKVGTLDFILN